MIDEKKQNVWSGEKEASFLRWILEKENRCPLTTCPVTVPGHIRWTLTVRVVKYHLKMSVALQTIEVTTAENQR
jgi:hypothetical protein